MPLAGLKSGHPKPVEEPTGVSASGTFTCWGTRMLTVSRLSTLALSCSLLGLIGCGSGSALSSSALPDAAGSNAAGALSQRGSSSTLAGGHISNAEATASPAQPLFSDNFSDGSAAAWTQTAGSWSVCHPAPGAPYAYCATGSGTNDTFAGSSSWTDYAVTVAVAPTFTNPPGSRQALDIVVRAKDTRHFDELELSHEKDGSQYWEMWRYASPGYQFLGRGRYAFTSGKSYWLRVTATGPQFTVAISTDGQNYPTLGTVMDSAYPGGGVGLRTWGGVTASFQSVVVTSAGTTASPSPSPSSSPTASPGPGVSEMPSQADAFGNSVGVDTTFVYSKYAYTTQWPAVSQLLIDSGIKHIRDSGPTTDQMYLSRMAMFSSHGIHHSLGMPIGSTAAQTTAALNTFGPANIDFVEPENEYDTYAKKDPNWAANIVVEQKAIWQAVRGNAAFNGVAVLGPAFANQNAYSVVGPLDAYEDAGNLHAGFCNYNPGTNNGTVNLTRVVARIRAGTTSKPIWTTETGFNDSTNVCDTPDSVTAKYDPRLIAERWNAGQPRSYIFQFVDVATHGDPFGYMGLVTLNGTPKPQYTALQSMLSLLSDPGSSFSPKTLNYALGGQTHNIHHTLLQKRDGTYVMMLWIEKPCLKSIYDPSITSVPSQQVSLSVPGMTAATDYTYDTSKWTLSPQSLAPNAGTVNLTLTDAISFIEFK